MLTRCLAGCLANIKQDYCIGRGAIWNIKLDHYIGTAVWKLIPEYSERPDSCEE